MRDQFVASGNAKSFPLFQLFARGYPPDGDDDGVDAPDGIDTCYETVWFWWNMFGPLFAAQIRKRRTGFKRAVPQWLWHLDEVFVKFEATLRSIVKDFFGLN